VESIIIETSPKRNFINSITVFSYKGGIKTAGKLSLGQRQIIVDFFTIAKEVHNLTGSYNFSDFGVSSYKYNPLRDYNENDEFTDYFKGIVSGCNSL